MTTEKPSEIKSNKGGRPSIEDSEKKKYPVKTRLKKSDYEKVKHEMTLLNMKESDFFREKLLSDMPSSFHKIPPGMIIELNRIGVNINQIAKKINATDFLSRTDSDRLQKTLGELADILRKCLL